MNSKQGAPFFSLRPGPRAEPVHGALPLHRNTLDWPCGALGFGDIDLSLSAIESGEGQVEGNFEHRLRTSGSRRQYPQVQLRPWKGTGQSFGVEKETTSDGTSGLDLHKGF